MCQAVLHVENIKNKTECQLLEILYSSRKKKKKTNKEIVMEKGNFQ